MSIRSIADQLATMTPSDIASHCQDCIKLAASNKITVKNAFHLHLIECLPMMLDRNDISDFQSASYSLDAGAKIYASRVDAIHKETFNVISLLGRSTFDIDDENNNNDEDNIDETLPNDPDSPTETADPLKKSKSLTVNSRKKGVIVQNLSKIRSKANFTLVEMDPLFQKQARACDEGGTAHLHLNVLSTFHYPSEFILDRNAKIFEENSSASSNCFSLEGNRFWRNEQPPSTRTTSSSNPFVVAEFATIFRRILYHSKRDSSLYSICPEYEHFVFCGDNQPNMTQTLPTNHYKQRSPTAIVQTNSTQRVFEFNQINSLIQREKCHEMVGCATSLANQIVFDVDDSDEDCHFPLNDNDCNVNNLSVVIDDHQVHVNSPTTPVLCPDTITSTTTESNPTVMQHFVDHLHEIQLHPNKMDESIDLFGVCGSELEWKTPQNAAGKHQVKTSTPRAKRIPRDLCPTRQCPIRKAKTEFNARRRKLLDDDENDKVKRNIKVKREKTEKLTPTKECNAVVEFDTMSQASTVIIAAVAADDDNDSDIHSPSVECILASNETAEFDHHFIPWSVDEIDKKTTSLLMDSGLGTDWEDSEFISPPKKMSRMNSSFNKSSHVDVKQLKDALRSLIQSPPPPAHEVEQVEESKAKLSCLINQLPSKIGLVDANSITCPIVFACLLHVANDMNLVVESCEQFDDVSISQSDSEDKNLAYILAYAKQNEQSLTKQNSSSSKNRKRHHHNSDLQQQQQQAHQHKRSHYFGVDLDCSDLDEDENNCI